MSVSYCSALWLKYLRGMMIVDFLAVFPFEQFIPKDQATFSGTLPNLNSSDCSV